MDIKINNEPVCSDKITDNRETICNGTTFNAICDNRFKTARISFNMIMPLEHETASLNAILPMLLRRSCKRYNNFRKLNQTLSALYGASIYADIKKIGEAHVLNISAAFIDERYLPNDEKLSLKICDLLCEMIFRPNTKNNEFFKEDVEQEKRQLIETLEAEFNDKRAYAKRRCEEIMCEEEKFSVNTFGSIEQIENINSENVYSHWKYVLENAKIEIIMLGSGDYSLIKDKFINEFKNINRNNPLEIKTQVIKSADKVKQVKDFVDVKQAKLVLGFRTKRSVNNNDVMATRVMTALFGGTPHSKLFTVVREKMSLCYYCSSIFHRNKGVMFVQSGVEQKNIDKAKDAVLNQLEAIKNGDFTENEIEATKLSIINAFNALTDSIGGLENWYISQLFEPYAKGVAENIKEVMETTKDDIIKAANEVTLDTVYVLASDKEDEQV